MNNALKKILIVEDDPLSLKAIVLKLKNNNNIIVETADDGEKALELLSRNAYDVLALDLLLPKKDGLTVLGEIKKRKLTPPSQILIISNLSQKDTMNKTKELGAQTYLIKAETSIDSLIEEILKALTK